MKSAASTPQAATTASNPVIGGSLFRRYVVFFVAMSAALILSGSFSVWVSYREQRMLLLDTQREQAKSAAEKISQFVSDIEHQIAWSTDFSENDASLDDRHADLVRLLRREPAITEIRQLDRSGHEQLHVSRFTIDTVGSHLDFSLDPRLKAAIAHTVDYGQVYFVRGSEPYMTVAVAGSNSDVNIAEINLKFIWDVVSRIKVGMHGQAYVVDGNDRLIAHPNLRLVLQNTDLSNLPQVQSARAIRPNASTGQVTVGRNIEGQTVLTGGALVPSLGWLVLVELPVDEAFAPLRASIGKSLILLGSALAVVFLIGLTLARRVIAPVYALRAGVKRIGLGDLTDRISVKTGDEFEALADEFNSMATRLQDSYSTLERKVEERTHQLELANTAKSRFLANASHDLRQPLHALGLFVAQLGSAGDGTERKRLLGRINSAIEAMNDLFNELLDISKLDAGALVPNITEFPISHVLTRIDSTFSDTAREQRLFLKVVRCSAWVRSDPVLLERIVLNLVSNAVRYTAKGGVVVGCRRRGETLRLEIWDSGPGIPKSQRQNIFNEFYRLPDAGGTYRGLGLGLAIVDRLCRLLHHPIELTSKVDEGSVFSVGLPLVTARAVFSDIQVPVPPAADACKGKLILVIDDDAMVLNGMRGLLEAWGCDVVSAASSDLALVALSQHDRKPDAIISDYRLANQKTGIEVITQLRCLFNAKTPAFLISGDTNPEPEREASAHGLHILHKPVTPMALRAILTQALKPQASVPSS
jgi:signal transduction histidine kinase/CheY-like chemotaxis protein